jgi:hypothetical protein
MPASMDQSETEWNTAITTLLLRSHGCSAYFLLNKPRVPKHGDHNCSIHDMDQEVFR